MNIPDNSKFEQMVRNRPPLSILPTVNKRVISQYLARNLYMGGAFALTCSIFLYKFWINTNSSPVLKTRKNFRFQADPYSGKVSCDFADAPNYQHGY